MMKFFRRNLYFIKALSWWMKELLAFHGFGILPVLLQRSWWLATNETDDYGRKRWDKSP